MLTGAFRAGSRLAVALSCLNAGVLLIDGLVHSERLSTQYLIVTAVAALMFGAIGAAIHGLHWSRDRIRSHSTGGDNRNVVADLAAPWTVVHLVLGVLLAVTALPCRPACWGRVPTAVRAPAAEELVRALRARFEARRFGLSPRYAALRSARGLTLPARAWLRVGQEEREGGAFQAGSAPGAFKRRERATRCQHEEPPKTGEAKRS